MNRTHYKETIITKSEFFDISVLSSNKFWMRICVFTIKYDLKARNSGMTHKSMLGSYKERTVYPSYEQLSFHTPLESHFNLLGKEKINVEIWLKLIYLLEQCLISDFVKPICAELFI